MPSMKQQTLALIILFATCIFVGGFLGTHHTGDILHTKQTEALGQTILIGAQGEQAEGALDAACREIERLDALFAYNGSGDIATLNKEKTITADPDTVALLSRAKEISADTGGLYSCTLAPVLDAWGFTTGDYQVPDDATLKSLLAHVDDSQINIQGNTITIPESVRVNVDSIARGYLADHIKKVFSDYALDRGFITLGLDQKRYENGDAGFLEGNGAATFSADLRDEKWSVNITNPADNKLVIANYQTLNDDVFTGAGYQATFSQNGHVYHHLIDPRTGYPAESGLASATVVAEDGVLAAALADTLCIMGRDDALAYWETRRIRFDAVLINGDVNDTAEDAANINGKDITITAGIQDKNGTAFTLVSDPGGASPLRKASDERATRII